MELNLQITRLCLTHNVSSGLIVVTEWNEFRGMDLDRLKTLLSNPIVLDTRNILSIEKLTKLGFTFDNVGRKIVHEN